MGVLVILADADLVFDTVTDPVTVLVEITLLDNIGVIEWVTLDVLVLDCDVDLVFDVEAVDVFEDNMLPVYLALVDEVFDEEPLPEFVGDCV
jgi:hypothetical protein